MNRPKPFGSADLANRDTLRVQTDPRAQQHSGTLLREDLLPVLVVIAGLDIGARCRLDRTVVVGRDPTADLSLSDPGVSWAHARIEDLGGAWGIVDLQSTNGVLVNGRRVTSQRLAPADKIVLARTVIQFEMHDAIDQAHDERVQFFLSVDDLTGLLVRRKFDAELDRLLSYARERTEPLGVLVMDLDGVKSINDAHGHLYGAHTIGEAGRLIGRVIGERGPCARFGGDEFVVALPRHDLEATVSVGNEILRAIGEHHFELDDLVFQPGISIGAAAFPTESTDATRLFESADQAMYRAKHNGRNRVCT